MIFQIEKKLSMMCLLRAMNLSRFGYFEVLSDTKLMEQASQRLQRPPSSCHEHRVLCTETEKAYTRRTEKWLGYIMSKEMCETASWQILRWARQSQRVVFRMQKNLLLLRIGENEILQRCHCARNVDAHARWAAHKHAGSLGPCLAHLP